MKPDESSDPDAVAILSAYLNLRPRESDHKRDRRFAPGNDRIWGKGNWVRCSICPHDAEDREVYHHKDAHA